jgi:hypothetical protein
MLLAALSDPVSLSTRGFKSRWRTCREISTKPSNKVVVVATGALTNVALLLSIYPELADDIEVVLMGGAMGTGRGLHSSTFRLNVSTFCGVRWVHDFPPVY